MSYRVVAIEEAVADEVRATGRAPGYGHPAHAEMAAGYGPCRSCLQPFRIGEERRLLFTYDPFRDLESMPLPGPVFVHEDACTRSTPARIPDAIRFIPFTLNAYGFGRELRAVVRLPAHGPLDDAIDDLLSRADVDYIHVRNTDAGCFVCRVQRTAGG